MGVRIIYQASWSVTNRRRPSSALSVVTFAGVSDVMQLGRLAVGNRQLEGVAGASGQDHNTP